jgi:hypothetical protein
MPEMHEPTRSTIALLRRIAELWPYAFILISVAGFVYIAMDSAR